jgi:hypothetical protein
VDESGVRDVDPSALNVARDEGPALERSLSRCARADVHESSAGARIALAIVYEET